MDQKILLPKSAIIGQLPLFAEFSPEDIEFVTENSEFKEFKKDDFIYKEGDAPSAFYCIISGRVKIFTTHNKKIEVLEYLHRGSYFGIISLLTGDTHSVSAQVINDVFILKIEKDKFDQILKRIPKLAIHFSSTLSRRLRRKDLGPKLIFESTIISIYAVAENVGRTLYALNLALSLIKETKKKAIFLDVGSGGEDAARFLKFDKKLPLLELKTVFFDEEKVKKSIIRHPSGIHFLNIAHDSSLVSEVNQVTSLLSYLTNEYHYLIVDLPIKMDDAVLNILTQSELVHLITDINEDNIVSTNKLIDILFKVIKNPKDKIKLIISELKGKVENFDAFSCKVHATLPDIKTDSHIKQVTGLLVQDMPDCEYAKAIRRISRTVGGMLVGLALSSGAALGLAHIGVIKVLEQENIPIDIVAGSSMGALIAAFWASGKNASQMEKIASASRKGIRLLSLRDLIFPTSGLISDKRIMKLLSFYLGDKTFQDIKLPLKIVATGFENREAVVIDSGKLVDAVRASISMPGVLRPRRIDSLHLLDGGILEPVPVSVLIRMGVKKIIAVNVLPSPSDIQRAFSIRQQVLKIQEERIKESSIVNQLLWKARKRLHSLFTPNILDIIVSSMQSMEYTLAERSCQQTDVYIHPDPVGLDWSDFFNVRRPIRRGQEAAERALVDIKYLVQSY